MELIAAAVSQVFDGAKDVVFSPVPPQAIWGSLIGTAGAIIVGVLGLVTSLINSRKIQEVHVLVDGQLAAYKDKISEVLVLEKQKSRDEGISDTLISQTKSIDAAVQTAVEAVTKQQEKI